METIRCCHCQLLTKIPPRPPVHELSDCSLTKLALWAASVPGRRVMDIHPYERIWMVSLQDRGGEPFQAHGQGENLHEAVSAALADYYAKRSHFCGTAKTTGKD